MDLADEATAMELLPLLYGDRGRAFLMGPHPASLVVKLGLYHLAKTAESSSDRARNQE